MSCKKDIESLINEQRKDKYSKTVKPMIINPVLHENFFPDGINVRDKLIYLAHLSKTVSITDLAHFFGTARSTIYRWLASAKEKIKD